MCFLKKLRGIVAYGIGGASENLDLGSRYGRRKVLRQVWGRRLRRE